MTKTLGSCKCIDSCRDGKYKWFGPVALGTTPVCSLVYTMEAQFVPGTNPVCRWDNPSEIPPVLLGIP